MGACLCQLADPWHHQALFNTPGTSGTSPELGLELFTRRKSQSSKTMKCEAAPEQSPMPSFATIAPLPDLSPGSGYTSEPVFPSGKWE